ncbi:hypothetical protein SJAV_11430 [Sulfurisphaera javensis]|uniref:Uncharacterized protein n=1 Tax=Sulfurisphaera javensis TaxID=2049879 RepID=A0AAT9GR79_9CREN
MYGDEERNIPPELLYTKYDAEIYLSQTKTVLSLVLKLIEEGTKTS